MAPISGGDYDDSYYKIATYAFPPNASTRLSHESTNDLLLSSSSSSSSLLSLTAKTATAATANASDYATSGKYSATATQFKLISARLQHFMRAALRAALLTLLILFLSSWIALASAAVELVPAAATTTVTEIAAAPAAAAAGKVNRDTAELQLGDALLLDTTATNAKALLAELELGNSSIFLAAVNNASSAASVNGSSSSSAVSFASNTSYSSSSISSAPPPYSNLGLGAPTALAFSTTSLYETLLSGVGGGVNAPTNVSLAQSTETSETLEGQYAIPPLHAVLVSIILLFVILGTVVGNVLVCIAVCMVRKLRRPCNYLLVSLALSDLCVAVLVMPAALLYEVLEKWNFGPLLCDIWVAFDVLCCTASILNLCAISVDRYLAITKPLEYGVKRTPRRMMLCVALVWLAAACISLPPLLILGNEHMDEEGQPICTVCQNFAYQIYATLGSFYIPLAVMLFVYYQIFRAARRIVLEEKRAQTHLQHALNGTGSPPPGNTDLSGNGQHRHSSYGNTSLTYSTCGGLSAGHGGGAGGSGGGVSGSSGLLGSPHQKKLRFQLAKEKKASTTLGIIMSAFTICWLPFFILALIRPFVESETVHVPQSLSSLFLWLGYANSLLNPIIYATLNRDFRKPFQEILYFRCSSLNTMMRENYYQDQYGEPPSQRVMLGDERHGARESFL